MPRFIEGQTWQPRRAAMDHFGTQMSKPSHPRVRAIHRTSSLDTTTYKEEKPGYHVVIRLNNPRRTAKSSGLRFLLSDCCTNTGRMMRSCVMDSRMLGLDRRQPAAVMSSEDRWRNEKGEELPKGVLVDSIVSFLLEDICWFLRSGAIKAYPVKRNREEMVWRTLCTGVRVDAKKVCVFFCRLPE